MNKLKRLGILKTFAILFIPLLFSFNASADVGEDLFKSKCTACHVTGARKLVGPGLAGISEKRDREWLYKWINNSKALIESGDSAAVQLFAEFNSIPMLEYDFTNEEIDAILAYIDSENAPKVATTAGAGEDVAATDAGGSEMGRYMKWTLWIIFFVVVVLAFFTYRMNKTVRKAFLQLGYFPEPFQKKKRGMTFGLMALVATFLILFLVNALQGDWGRIDQLMFFMFPYATLLIFLVGSIYRYKKSSFQVSSLSSQFLEGKQLFFGSQPFHWGLLVLFFGHLIAFLFPKSLMAWNGEPVRLLIIEFSSFAFALCALTGLVLLIKRRMFSRRILEVTNKMDMLVYVILLVQILSGLGVAFFVRWGSSWFAAVLTPYLRGIFTLNPDITAISSAPILIQIHIISAFFIIAVLPFTRFMHFLVTPLNYVTRSEQLVFWNWNKNMIRKTTKYFFGHKPRNH
jgi:nitrate reductase gamma subunit